MPKNENITPDDRGLWEKPEVTDLEIDLSCVATAMNPGSDAGNGRSSSGS
jgi:hypothetical protein